MQNHGAGWLRLAGIAALLTAGLGALRADPGLPDRLEIVPPPSALPTPEALLEEADQAAQRVSRPTYAQSVARLVSDARFTLAIERALSPLEGRHFPRRYAPGRVTLPPAPAPSFFSETQVLRGRLLDLVEALARERPDQSLELLRALPSDAAGSEVRSRLAYHSAVAAADVDPLRAEEMAAAVADPAMRGSAWDRVGQAWLRSGSWSRAFNALEAATGPGRLTLFAAMARDAAGGNLDRLTRSAATPEMKALLVGAIAVRDPQRAWDLAQALRGTPHFLPAAVSVAAAFAPRDPDRSVGALEAAIAAMPAGGRVLLPGVEELSVAFARIDARRAVETASRLRGGPEDRDPGPVPEAGEAERPGETNLARLAAGVSAYDVPRAAALLQLLQHPRVRESAWEAAGGNAAVRGLAEVDSLAALAGGAAERSWCLAGAARQLQDKDSAGAFALALRIPDPRVRAAVLNTADPAPAGERASPSAGEIAAALAATATELVPAAPEPGSIEALGRVLRRLAQVDPPAVTGLLGSLPDQERWRDFFANQVGPVSPALAESLSPEVGRYWTRQLALRQVQTVAERDPQAVIDQVKAVPAAGQGPGELYRSRALVAAGKGLALRDPDAAIRLAGEINDVEERSHYLVALAERIQLDRFAPLIAAARSLPEDEWKARALAGVALELAGHSAAAGCARAADAAGDLSASRFAAFYAPLLAETHYNLARSLARSGGTVEAQAAARRYLELRPNSPLTETLQPLLQAAGPR